MLCGLFIMSCNVVLAWCVFSWCGISWCISEVVKLPPWNHVAAFAPPGLFLFCGQAEFRFVLCWPRLGGKRGAWVPGYGVPGCGKRGVWWKTRGLVENAGSGGKLGLVENAGCGKRGVHPRTQRLRSLWPAVGNERPWKDPILKSENTGLPVQLRMPA